MPLHRVSRIDAEPFRVLLLRRLRLPLPLSVRTCLCGCLLDVLGHHRAACGRSGVLGRRVFALESAVSQICRESGARVTTNVMLRRLEVVAEGLTLYGWCQVALDPTLVSPLRGGGVPRRNADVVDGVALTGHQGQTQNVPGALSRRWKGKAGRHRWGGGRPLLTKDKGSLLVLGVCQSSARDEMFVRKCACSLVPPVVLFVGLLRSEGIRNLSDGCEGGSWRRRRRPFSSGSAGERPARDVVGCST